MMEVTEVTEVVSKTLARTPPSTHAGGQDDGSTQTPSNETCAWTPNKVLSNLVVPALVASEVPERQFFGVLASRREPAILKFRLLAAGLGKSRQVGGNQQS